MFHMDCATKQDKNLKLNKKIQNSRKFVCKLCYRKASGQKKRGRKSNKELKAMLNKPNRPSCTSL